MTRVIKQNCRYFQKFWRFLSLFWGQKRDKKMERGGAGEGGNITIFITQHLLPNPFNRKCSRFTRKWSINTGTHWLSISFLGDNSRFHPGRFAMSLLVIDAKCCRRFGIRERGETTLWLRPYQSEEDRLCLSVTEIGVKNAQRYNLMVQKPIH